MSTTDDLAAGEDFLRSYHNRIPGSMPSSVISNAMSDGRTSYQVLVDRVAGAQHVLDLGCADGTLPALLADSGTAGLAGIDLSEGELALARKRPQLRDADLRLGRAQQLPFADNSFDAVVSHMALMLMSDIDQVVAETARVLRPGGTLAVAVGAGAVPGGALDIVLSLARPVFAELPSERRIPPMGDRRTRSRQGLDEILTPAGFAPVSWEEITLECPRTPQQVWDSIIPSYYDLATLNDDQITQLRHEFLALADNRLVGGARIAIATTHH